VDRQKQKRVSRKADKQTSRERGKKGRRGERRRLEGRRTKNGGREDGRTGGREDGRRRDGKGWRWNDEFIFKKVAVCLPLFGNPRMTAAAAPPHGTMWLGDWRRLTELAGHSIHSAASQNK